MNLYNKKMKRSTFIDIPCKCIIHISYVSYTIRIKDNIKYVQILNRNLCYLTELVQDDTHTLTHTYYYIIPCSRLYTY